MLQPRLPNREASLNILAITLNNLALCTKHTPRKPQFIFTRYASHAAQGRANGPKDSAGRRLGAKKASSEYVIPGNIIFKQRGTKWFPGENVGIGKDHTIYATQYGYVRYYRNPTLHPKRRYIGVALAKDGPASQLPTPPNAPTRRRLGMMAVPMKHPSNPLTAVQQASADMSFLEAHVTESSGTVRPETVPVPPQAVNQGGTQLGYALRHGGHGMANHEIGRAAERKGVTVKEFDRKDRWTAWRVRNKKVKEKMQARAMQANRKTKGKKSAKKV